MSGQLKRLRNKARWNEQYLPAKYTTIFFVPICSQAPWQLSHLWWAVFVLNIVICAVHASVRYARTVHIVHINCQFNVFCISFATVKRMRDVKLIGITDFFSLLLWESDVDFSFSPTSLLRMMVAAGQRQQQQSAMMHMLVHVIDYLFSLPTTL